MTEPIEPPGGFPYKSDRWITPGVVVAFLIVAGLLIGLMVGATAWLTSIDRDPEPLVRLTASLLAAAGALGSFALNLAQRRTATKTERSVGTELPAVRAELANVRAGQHRMAEALWDVADALPRPVPRHAADPPTVATNGATPTLRGE